jgi:hypothetical protein
MTATDPIANREEFQTILARVAEVFPQFTSPAAPGRMGATRALFEAGWRAHMTADEAKPLLNARRQERDAIRALWSKDFATKFQAEAAADLAQDARILAGNLLAAANSGPDLDSDYAIGKMREAADLLNRLAAYIAQPEAVDEDAWMDARKRSVNPMADMLHCAAASARRSCPSMNINTGVRAVNLGDLLDAAAESIDLAIARSIELAQRSPVTVFKVEGGEAFGGRDHQGEFAAPIIETGEDDRTLMNQADAERVASTTIADAIGRRDPRPCGDVAQLALDAFEPGRWVLKACDFDNDGRVVATVRLR